MSWSGLGHFPRGQLPCPFVVAPPIVVPDTTPPAWLSLAITLIGKTARVPATAAAARILRTVVIVSKAFLLDWPNDKKVAGT